MTHNFTCGDGRRFETEEQAKAHASKVFEKTGNIISVETSERVKRLLPNGGPRYVRCYDNGGETLDRYTAVYTGRYTHKTGGQHWDVCMNAAPFHPQGIGQHGEHDRPIDALNGKWPPAMGRSNHLGKRIPFAELPEDCRKVVMQDYLYLWDLPGARKD